MDDEEDDIVDTEDEDSEGMSMEKAWEEDGIDGIDWGDSNALEMNEFELADFLYAWEHSWIPWERPF